MQIAPALRTHAQNRFLRRLSNREGITDSPVGPRGSPIPGDLTPTEVAHKARRRNRRIAVLSSDSKTIPFEINRINTLLAKLEKETPKSPEAQKEQADRIIHLLNSRDRLTEQFCRVDKSLARLTTLA